MGTDAHRESEKARTQRLTADGRLAAFHRRVTELKSGAANKVERQQAWRLAIEEFAEPEPDPNEELVDPEAFADRPPSTRASAIRWTADNIALSGVEPGDAPRPDAAGLLAWVRRSQANQTVFWSRMYPLVLPTRQTMESDESRFEKNPLLEKVFEEGRQKVLQAAADARESWWTGLYPTLIKHPMRWRQLKAHIDHEIERRGAARADTVCTETGDTFDDAANT